MKPQPTADEIFYEARGLDPSLRDEFLTRECGDDEGLRVVVEGLLSADSQANDAGFLSGLDANAGTSEGAAYESLGSYHILRELGRGAQATVYLAHDGALNRHVALKVLRNVLPDEASTLVRRFRREATAMASLEHPGLCTVYETGVDEDVAWIAMRYVSGRSLAELLDERDEGTGLDLGIATGSDRAAARGNEEAGVAGSAPGSGTDAGKDGGAGRRHGTGTGSVTTRHEQRMRTVAFFEQAARALHVAHEHGLVHRDVKPANLMATDEGQPVLLDFGVAHAIDSDDGLGLTRTADLLGTPAYMAPEQLRGRRGQIDCRVDVYGLGITLYECLAGRRPHHAASREALYRQILDHEPRPLRRITSGISRDLDIVVATAMDKDPQRRYASALDFAEDLGRVRCFDPILARPISVFGRTVRWARRWPLVAASLGLTLAASTAGLAVSLTSLRTASTAIEDRDRALEAKLRAQQAWYEPQSKRAAYNDMHGRNLTDQWRLRDMALFILDGELPRQDEVAGFRERWDASDRNYRVVGDHAGLWRRRAEALLEISRPISALGRLCVADLGVLTARGILAGPGAQSAAADALGIRLVRHALDQLSEFPPSDQRVIRGRLLLAEALLQIGHHDEASPALEEWIEGDRVAAIPTDRARTALYEVRLASALLASGGAENVERAAGILATSQRLVVEHYPGSWYGLGAYAARVELLEAQGSDELERARHELGAAIYRVDWDDVSSAPTRRLWRIWYSPWSDLWDLLLGKYLAVDQGMEVDELHAVLEQVDGRLKEMGAGPDGFRSALVGMWAGGLASVHGNLGSDRRRAPQTRILAEYASEKLSSTGTPLMRFGGVVAHALHHIERGEYSAAIDVCERELVRLERGTFFYRRLAGYVGLAAQNQGRFAEAEPLVLDALDVKLEQLGPASKVTTSNLAWLRGLYYRWGKPDLYLQWHQGRAESLGFAVDPRQLAYALLAIGRPDEAQRVLDRAGDDDDGGSLDGLLRGRLALIRGDHEEALRIATVGIDEGRPMAWSIRARALLLRDGAADVDQALEAFEEFRKTGNTWFDGHDTNEPWVQYGIALDAANRSEEAVLMLEELTSNHPGDPLAWHARARVLAIAPGLEAHREEAVTYAETAVGLPQGSARAVFRAGLAEAQFAAGRVEEARTTIDAVLARMNGENGLWLTLADATALARRIGQD